MTREPDFKSDKPQPFQSDPSDQHPDPKALERAEKVIGTKVESTFAKNLKKMLARLTGKGGRS